MSTGLRKSQMKKMIAFIAIAVMLFSVSIAESNEKATDVTYRTLYNVLSQGMKTDEGTEDQLRVEDATVWKINDSKAGFTFQGHDWFVLGEADMETGVILKLTCKLPYSAAGIIMTYMTTMVLSEEVSADAYIQKYVGENSLLNGNSFPHYENTLDAGNADNIVYEFTRVGSYDLTDENNRCDMKQLIQQLQTF